LHNEIIQLLAQSAAYRMADDALLYSVAYRPASRNDRAEIDLWRQTLALGQGLPTMPLALKGAGVVGVDLESAYGAVCRRRQLV
jgi:hypothetical protein